MNKKILLLLVVIIIAGGAYLLINSEKTDAPITNETTTAVEVNNSDYIGMTTVEAEAKAESEGVIFRVVEKDGQSLPAARDSREGRINASVESGIVTEYSMESRNSIVEETKELEPTEETLELKNAVVMGVTLEEAQAYAEDNNVDFRIGSLDGDMRLVTMDHRPGRITVEIENNIVIGYSVE